MKIQSINTFINKQNIACNTNKYKQKNIEKNNKLEIKNIPTTSIKAKFLPSFGNYKKIADITLINKDTEMPVRATLRRVKTGDFVSFQIITGRKDEAGFLHMNLDPISVRGDKILKNKKGEPIPEVTHLRSISGDKYKGIGTTLINAAINESLKEKKAGALFLKAETGYGSCYSDYRKNESPIPFYYKMGFKAYDKEVDNLIQECIKKAEYEKLPPSALLILSEEAIKEKNISFSKNYKFD